MSRLEAQHQAAGSIAAPRFVAAHPEYVLECEEALEPALIAAIDAARAAGWKSGAIWPALLSLITNLELSEIENRRTRQAIARASLKPGETL